METGDWLTFGIFTASIVFAGGGIWRAANRMEQSMIYFQKQLLQHEGRISNIEGTVFRRRWSDKEKTSV